MPTYRVLTETARGRFYVNINAEDSEAAAAKALDENPSASMAQVVQEIPRESALFDAISRRDLNAISEMLYPPHVADLRARLDLEARDEPREYASNIEPNTGLRRHGEI